MTRPLPHRFPFPSHFPAAQPWVQVQRDYRRRMAMWATIRLVAGVCAVVSVLGGATYYAAANGMIYFL